MGKKILVTGGAGYIGSHMVKKLVSEGFSPIIFDNLSTGHEMLLEKNVPFYEGDLGARRDIAVPFEDHKIDAVIHFASSSIVGESIKDPLKYYKNNVAAFVSLLREIVERDVKHIIFSSTAAVFGDQAEMPLSEEDEKKPMNPYGSSKLMMEKILRDSADAHDLSYVILRYFNVAGAHESGEIGENHEPETHLIPNILNVALGKQREFTICGDDYPTVDGTCVRDFIHVEDLCHAHFLALEYLFEGNEKNDFNLGSGKGYSVKEVLECASQATGIKIPVVVGPRRPNEPAILVASSKKAEKDLGWTPQKKLIDIIHSAMKWHEKEIRQSQNIVSAKEG